MIQAQNIIDSKFDICHRKSKCYNHVILQNILTENVTKLKDSKTEPPHDKTNN